MTEKKDEQAKTLANLTRVRSDNEQLKRELQEAGRRLAELTDLTSSSSLLESQLREAKHAEEAERILNQKLNKELHHSKDTVAKLRKVVLISSRSFFSCSSYIFYILRLMPLSYDQAQPVKKK